MDDTKLFPARGSFGGDIPSKDGKTANLFYSAELRGVKSFLAVKKIINFTSKKHTKMVITSNKGGTFGKSRSKKGFTMFKSQCKNLEPLKELVKGHLVPYEEPLYVHLRKTEYEKMFRISEH